MSFFSTQMKYKTENQSTYQPCVMEITDSYLVFQKRSVAGMAVGGLVGAVISETARNKNGIVAIPISQITAVETKSTFATALVIVTAQGHPKYTFACTSKKEMNRIADLLKN